MNKIYLVSRAGRIGWDEYIEFVCVAASEERARMLHPNGYAIDGTPCTFGDSWPVKPQELKVVYVGDSEREESIICDSFNAG